MSKRVLLMAGFLLVLTIVLTGCVQGNKNVLAMESLPRDLTVQQVKDLYDAGEIHIIDVREQSEYDAGHIPGVQLIPLGTIPVRVSEVPTDQTVVVVCRSGNRSNQAVTYLEDQGFTNVHNMLGGMNNWASAGFPIEQ